MGRQSLMNARARGARLHGAQLQRHRHRHAFVEVVDDRRKHRRLGKSGIRLHFRQMLVRHAQCVKSGCIQGPTVASSFIVGDHGLAATRIAGQRVTGDRVLARQQADCHQWRHSQNESGCMAAGDRHAARVCNRLALPGTQLWQPIDPALGHTVRGTGVNDCRARVAGRHKRH